MKKIILILTIAFSSTICLSQITKSNLDNITWGNVEKIKKHLEPILIGEVGDELLFLNYFYSKVTIQKYNKNSLLLTNSKTIEFENKKVKYIDISIINQQPFVFTSFFNKTKNVSYIYSQKLDVNNLTLNKKKVIVEYDYNLVKKVELTKAEKIELKAKLKKELMQQISLDMAQDQNISSPKTILNLYTCADNSFTFLNYGDITKQSQYETQSALIGKLFDNKLNELNKFEYNIPFTEFEICETKISNNAKAFILINKLKFHNKASNEILFEHNIESTHLLTIDLIDGKSELINIELEDRCFSEVTMKILKNGGLIIAGLTSKINEFGIDELYSISFDKNMNKSKVSQTKINNNFIIDSWSEQEKALFEKENKKKGIKAKKPLLFNYIINNIIELNNGSITVLTEQYITSKVIYKQMNTAMTTPESTPYIYNHIIAINYDQTGEFQWIKRIEKRQQSWNDNGEYSSYFAIPNNNFIDIIYNDKRTPIKVQLSTDGTTMIKENFIEFPEKSSVLLPKKCVMINENEFLLHTTQKSGIIKF
jgi:hypothetical protein